MRAIQYCFYALAFLVGVASSRGAASSSDAAASVCAEALNQAAQPLDLETQIADFPQTQAVVEKLKEFALAHDLPMRILEVGPPQRRLKRLFVPIDVTNSALVASYLHLFNFDSPLDERTPGTLSFEFSFEKEADAYIYTMVRTASRAEAPIYLYGRPDMTWAEQMPNFQSTGTPIVGYAHLFALSAAEKNNIQVYLAKPENRAPADPGRSNCISWSCGIELGESTPSASDETRKFLFNELGMARSTAPFEIARRWMHAASARHAAVAVYVNGESGLKLFREGEPADIVRFDPKIPYASVIRNLPLEESHPALAAVHQLPDGARIFFPIAAGASPTAFHALMQDSESRAKGFHTYLLVNGISETLLTRAVAPPAKIKITSFFLGANLRRLYRRGLVDVVPDYLSQFTRRLEDPSFKDYDFDAMVVRVAPPDGRGHYSLGPNYDMVLSILKSRPDIKIIAEVNPHVPRTRGDNYLTAHQLFAKFEDFTELASPVSLPVTTVEENIGKNLAGLIASDSYLQIGIGNVFDGLPPALKGTGVKNLTLFTELFGDSMMQLMKDGVANRAETGFAFGSRKLYQWLNDNQRVLFRPTDYVNDPIRIAGFAKFQAVNTALQVNLRGDANATHGEDGARMSSPGGQVDFMFGASRSRGGKSIVALRSTAKYGTVSTIVLDLYAGNTTTSHEIVSHVVTEYGVAELAGKTERERAIQLINIAHPNFRPSLFSDAVTRKILTASAQGRIHFQPPALSGGP